MSAAAQAIPLAARAQAEHAAVAAALSQSVAQAARRRAALELLATEGLPTNRDENWRYANLRPLEQVRFAPRLPDAPLDIARIEALLPAPIPGFDRYVYADGLLCPALSAGTGSRDGVLVRSEAAAESTLESTRGDARFAALNLAFATDALRIDASRGAARNIEVIFVALTPASELTSYPRLHVELEPGASLRLIERHVGEPDTASFSNATVGVGLGEGATLRHYRVQDVATSATWIETLNAALATRASYSIDSLALGARSARSTLQIHLAGADSAVELAHAVAIDGLQVNDSYAVVDHNAPGTRTFEAFRGIAAGRSKVAFNGRIVMQRGSTKAASAQSLRSLLAGPGAEANVRPQLEIYTDDVTASHGATAGKLDDDMLFYLLSRGIDRTTARSLLKWAFLSEVAARIDVPELRSQMERALARRFQGEDADVARELV